MQSSGTDGNGPGSDGQSPGDATADAALRMRGALAAAMQGTGTQAELAAAAHALVTALRRAQKPPEEMLLTIKEILAESGLRPTYATDPPGVVVTDGTLYRNVIAWSIRYYYEDGAGK